MAPRTQDLIFTLYGDYITRGGVEAWTGGLIRLMDCLGAAEQAVHSALSRMVRRGWLTVRHEGRFSFHSLTPRGRKLMAEGEQRIFHPRQEPWDGRWCVLTYSIPESQRHLRDRLRQRLIWLGFGMLNAATWISPRDLRAELDEVIESLRIRPYVEIFIGQRLSRNDDRELVARCWNLEALNRAYADFIAKYAPGPTHLVAHRAEGSVCTEGAAFAIRFWVVHDYRSLPYVDPNLPPELLPDNWLGQQAAQLLHEYHDLLAEPANAFVDRALAWPPPDQEVKEARHHVALAAR